jgi:hypothetical protein
LEETSNAFIVLVGEPKGKRLMGRSKHGWGNNSKIDVREI